MRLYSMHKREFVMVFVAFFACFGLAVFIGLTGEILQNLSTSFHHVFTEKLPETILFISDFYKDDKEFLFQFL